MVKAFDIGDGYVNINAPDDILEAERRNSERFASHDMLGRSASAVAAEEASED
jgi:hypothetical protein